MSILAAPLVAYAVIGTLAPAQGARRGADPALLARLQPFYNQLAVSIKKRDAKAYAKLVGSKQLPRFAYFDYDNRSYKVDKLAAPIAKSWSEFAKIESVSYKATKSAPNKSPSDFNVIVKRIVTGKKKEKGKLVPYVQTFTYRDWWTSTPKGEGLQVMQLVGIQRLVDGKRADPPKPKVRVDPNLNIPKKGLPPPGG